MKILALDLGAKTGWATQGLSGNIVSGVVNLKQDRWEGGGMRFLKFVNFLNDLKESVGGFHSVYYEEVRRHMGVDAAHAYGGYLAYLTGWCEENSIPYLSIPVKTIKKFMTGRGNANKQQVIDAVNEKGFDVHDDNEADAIAILHYVKENMRSMIK